MVEEIEPGDLIFFIGRIILILETLTEPPGPTSTFKALITSPYHSQPVIRSLSADLLQSEDAVKLRRLT